jgi:hypothetical protein
VDCIPGHTPLGIQLDESRREWSRCLRCETCDGYPCLVQAKSDAEVCAVRPVVGQDQVTLLTETKAERFLTDATGREVTGIEVMLKTGERAVFQADVYVASCGSINTAALLFRSANDRHPDGLANSSGLVGRHLMKHVLGSLIGVSSIRANPTRFQKSLSLFDYYWGEPASSFHGADSDPGQGESRGVGGAANRFMLLWTSISWPSIPWIGGSPPRIFRIRPIASAWTVKVASSWSTRKTMVAPSID